VFILEEKKWDISHHDYYQLQMDSIYNGYDDVALEEAMAIYKNHPPDENLLDRLDRIVNMRKIREQDRTDY
jgi:hypothetical protein